MATTKVTDALRNVTVVDGTKISGAVPSGALTNVDLSKLEYNQAILAFKIASTNQLAKFQMVDQVIDEYQDATGIDAGASTNESARGATTAKYYEGGATGSDATGGTITTYSEDGVDYKVHTFTSTGSTNFVTSTSASFDLMLIAGGGGGGADTGATGAGGGGGAGGLKYYVGRTVAAGTHAVVVGTAGAGATGHTDKGDTGAVTTFTASGIAALSASGGGGAGSRSTNPALDGGSGGGGGQRDDSSANYGNGVTNEGNRGGSGNEASAMSGGGGGGAGAVGSDSTSGSGGNGGAGVVEGTTSVYDWQAGSSTTLKINGTDNQYAGGGGGAGASSQGTASHGGGAVGAAGGANTGGGGGAHSSVTGFAGGTGTAVIRYVVGSFITSGANLTLQSVATTAEAAPTTADLVILIEDNEGVATENTHIKAYVSRASSADFTDAVTLVDEGHWGTTTKRILVARNIDLTPKNTGTSMRYKIETLVQSAGGRETRIHATSLAWA